MPNSRVTLGLLVWMASGCGYRFTAGGAPFPEGIRAAHVPIFVNRTAEPGLEVAFTEALRGELVRSGRDGEPGGPAIIRGEVLSVSSAPTILTAQGSLASYRIFADAKLQLIRGDKVLVEAFVNGAEDYIPGVDILQSEANRQAALRRLAESLMRDGYSRLTTGW